MTKLAPEWVRTSDPVIRSPARYRWTTAPTKSIVMYIIYSATCLIRTAKCLPWTVLIRQDLVSWLDNKHHSRLKRLGLAVPIEQVSSLHKCLLWQVALYYVSNYIMSRANTYIWRFYMCTCICIIYVPGLSCMFNLVYKYVLYYAHESVHKCTST